MSYTLRDLPLPVKVVASVFLMAVGVGYTSAMVQLHMQDAKTGKPMPTVDDVIRKYTGKVKYDSQNPPPAPVSRLESLVMGADDGGITGQTMAPAFTTKDRAEGDGKFHKMIAGKSEKEIEGIKAQRKGEQNAIRLWINTPDDKRKDAYEADRFELPDAHQSKPFTAAFKDGNAVKIKSLLNARCATCHSKGDEKEDVPLTTYDDLAKFMKVEQPAVVNGYIRVEEPLSLTKLTQSTHAHLLSFAVLFSLTGGIFAFSSYNTKLRCLLGPWVVLAVFADVSLWWLARLSEDWGPYFAMGIVFTGAAAGAGLFGQIVLSLFNMYGMKGKVVLALLFLLGGGIASLIWVNKIDPGLKEKDQQRQQQKDAQKVELSKAKENGSGKDNSGNGKDTPPKKDDVVKNIKPHVPINALDRLLTLPRLDDKGQPIPNDQLSWDGSGSMAPAFFEKDKSKAFSKMMDDPAVPQADKDKLKSHRQAELDAALAWIRSADDARKAAYEGDSFGVAAELAGKVTPDFVKDGKVKIKSLIDARCAACHSPGKPQKGLPLTSYEEIAEYLKPEAPAAKAVDPIPEAKDD